MKLLRHLGLAIALLVPAFALAGTSSIDTCCPGPCCKDGGCPHCPR